MIVGSLQKKESIVNHSFDSLPFSGISWLKKEGIWKMAWIRFNAPVPCHQNFRNYLWGKVIL